MSERDPNGMSAEEPGAKLDDGKVDMTYLRDWRLALEAVCRVADYGAKKYSRNGWLAVPDGVRRYTAALLRHVIHNGQPDPVPDIPRHLVHDVQVAWNALSRLELILRNQCS